jgi:hypothetical protein
MEKNHRPKTSSVNSKLAEVLVKLQDRLSRVAGEAAIAIEALEERTIALGHEAERESKLNLSRAQLAAKENANLKLIVTEVVKLNQKLNERIGLVESQNATLKSFALSLVNDLAARISKTEANADEALQFKRNLQKIVNSVTPEAGRPMTSVPYNSSTITDLWKTKL